MYGGISFFIAMRREGIKLVRYLLPGMGSDA